MEYSKVVSAVDLPGCVVFLCAIPLRSAFYTEGTLIRSTQVEGPRTEIKGRVKLSFGKILASSGT